MTGGNMATLLAALFAQVLRAAAQTTTSCHFDCQAGINNWKAAWAEPKKAYCCEHENIACENPVTTTSCHFDCTAGFNNWKAAWATQKKEWCCTHEHVACEGDALPMPPVTTTTSCHYDCQEGFNNWKAGWAQQKKDYCCKHESVACPETTTTSCHFDCTAGFNNWKAAWAPQKKEYCCKHENVACPETTPAPTTAPPTTAPLPKTITTCKLACYGRGARPVLLPGSVGTGAGASLNDVSLDTCRRACAGTVGCDAVMYTDKTKGVPFKSMCYGKREIHTDKCQLGGSFITEVMGSDKRVMGKCAIFGDPHVISFDRVFGPPTTIIEPGVYHLIKSPRLMVHGRFGYTERFPTASSAVGVAAGGSLLKGHKLVVAYIGPEKGYKGFKVFWDGQPILESYPSTYTSSDGALTAQHDAMDPQEYHREGRHTIGGTEGRLPSYHFKLGEDLSIYVLIGPDNCNVVIEAARQPEGQDGWCGNFNCDQDDDAIAALRARGMADEVPAAQNLFNGSPPPPAWVMKKVAPPSLKECAPSIKAAAETKCANLPNGEKESCIFDACAAAHAEVAADADVADAGQGNSCNAACEFEGKAVSCKARVMWASKHQFLNQEGACQKGLDLVRSQCDGACDECTAELTGCNEGLHLHFFQKFTEFSQVRQQNKISQPLMVALGVASVVGGFFAVSRWRQAVRHGLLTDALE